MQDEHALSRRNKTEPMSVRSQRLLMHFKNQWSEKQEPSCELIQRLLADLPGPYRDMAITSLAERLVNDMKLHFLDIIATFYQKAEQEGIDEEEREETLRDIEADTLQLMELSKNISISSLDELLQLSNITSGLEMLSRSKDAESAQSWMYKLPALYQERVEQEHLPVRKPSISFFFSFDSTKVYRTHVTETPLGEIEASSSTGQ